MLFCFVILHYKTAKDTIDCVRSIKAMQTPSQIVIVDNFSDNGSIEILEEKYSGDECIHIIKNKQNLGFSAGNNVGYKYAREVLHSDYIAVSNNDIVIASPDMVEMVSECYNENKFHLLGPDIESLVDHKHQNPMPDGMLSIQQVNHEIKRYELLYLLSKSGLYDLLRKDKNPKMDHQNGLQTEIVRDIQLHGAFVIFSPAFVEKEEYAFRPGTFLYMEESILYKYCQKKGYLCVYNPEVKVLHKEDSSTNSLFKANKEKREFVFKNMIQSLKVYRKVLQDE